MELLYWCHLCLRRIIISNKVLLKILACFFFYVYKFNLKPPLLNDLSTLLSVNSSLLFQTVPLVELLLKSIFWLLQQISLTSSLSGQDLFSRVNWGKPRRFSRGREVTKTPLFLYNSLNICGGIERDVTVKCFWWTGLKRPVKAEGYIHQTLT